MFINLLKSRTSLAGVRQVSRQSFERIPYTYGGYCMYTIFIYCTRYRIFYDSPVHWILKSGNKYGRKIVQQNHSVLAE